MVCLLFHLYSVIHNASHLMPQVLDCYGIEERERERERETDRQTLVLNLVTFWPIKMSKEFVPVNEL